MADTSSDDELPLAQRPIAALFGAPRPAAPAAASDSESDFPSWLQTGAAGHKGNQVITLTDSESDDAVLSPPKPTAAAAAAAAAEPAGNRDVQQPPTQQTAEKKPQTAKAAAAAPKSAAKQKATPRGRAAAAAAGAGDEEAPSQPPATQPPASQPATQQGGTATKRGPAAGLGLPHAPTSQMPVVLPEKLPQMKMLVELESNPDDAHHVTDLSGDSGAIGRLVIAGTKEAPEMQIDLKGVLYNATIVPCPVSIAVINMGQTEAKVECLFSEFVQLREDTRFSFVDTEVLGGMDDDDDHYVGDGEDGGAAGAANEAGGAKKGRGKASAAGKAKAAPRKRAAPKAKGGVKKGAGKARAKPKPKAGAKKK